MANFREQRDLMKEINAEYGKQTSALQDAKKAMTQLTDVASQLKNQEEELVNLSDSQLKKLKERAASSVDELKNLGKTVAYTRARTDEEKALKKAAQANFKLEQELLDAIEKEVKEREKINKKMGITGGLLKGISKIPILGDIFDANKALDDMRKKGGSLGAGIKSIGKQFTEGVFNTSNLIVGSFGLIVSLVKDFDKGAGKFAKSMNMTYNESLAVRNEMNDVALSSGVAAVNSARLMETQAAVGASLGSNARLSAENAVQFTKMREMAGMTNEELMGITNLSLAGGKSIKQNTKEFMAQAKITGLQNGAILNEKTLLADIDKISKATTLSLGKNPKELAKAVATAKSLGMTMEQIEASASSLLDFESSIENELSAELLLGKNINLERARTAALNNDIAGLAKEINSQIGSSADFSKMNRIQQEALAKDVGMNRESLAETLFTQEALKGLSGDDLENKKSALNARIEEVGLAQAQRELEDGSLETLENQQGISEKFNDQMLQLKEILVNGILPPFMAIGGFLSEHIGIVKAMVGLFGVMKTAQMAFNAQQKIAVMLGKASKTRTMSEAVASIYKGSFSSVGMTPFVGAALATIAAGVAIASLFSSSSEAETKGNDVFSPGGKGAGFGSRTLMGPEGAISLNNKDDVVAGTDLFKKGGNTGGGANMAQTNALLQQLINIISAGGNVTLDGQKVGEALNLVSYKIQ
tara:strand:+ start:985 stop:3099 length:2115 start_codon:yes stop_codon:yes gene_type:complete